MSDIESMAERDAVSWSPCAPAHPYYDLAAAQWAQRWPVEELWAAHLAT
jgi:hypothetical protein